MTNIALWIGRALLCTYTPFHFPWGYVLTEFHCNYKRKLIHNTLQYPIHRGFNRLGIVKIGWHNFWDILTQAAQVFANSTA